jgi:hypothetical protein
MMGIIYLTPEAARANGIEHLYSSISGLGKIPDAVYEGCVLVPFALTAFIPESAIRKFAAKKPFMVHLNDGVDPHTVAFFGDIHNSPLKV